MRRILAVLVLLGVAAGCGSARRAGLAPKPGPTDEQAYLTGFVDGYNGVRPLGSYAGGRRGHSSSRAYQRGVRDGYVTGRSDSMQRR
ncbi:MAG: hypothetical protein FJ280_16570 [Planctomycetes bacterium]|nr:hypothetical protein [Planctomycetota bacterium]